MHHVRSIKKLKAGQEADLFTRQMIPINRKQIPICREHHGKLHNRSLSREEMQKVIENSKRHRSTPRKNNDKQERN